MRFRLAKLSCLFVITLIGFFTARASVIYTYDFPGSPGSGLATEQTNGEPTGATFSDFTRNGGLTGTGAQGVFGSKNWSQGSTLDPTVFAAFTLTANPLYQLNLSQLTFDSLKNGAGTIQAEVALFVNGSSTAYATFAWTPVNAPMTSYTFNFTPLTNADNVTSATFKFFGWNANDATNEIQFSNVETFGAIVPESDALWPVVLLVICVLAFNVSRRAGRPGI